MAALTRTPLTGALAGMVVTAVMQSSSATTVMVIGFVSAGLLELPQAVAVIFGANIGTTVTAQLLAFRVEEMLGVVLFGSFFLCAVARTERGRQMGTAVFSFGLLFAGMEQIRSVVEPLALCPEFEAWMAQVREKPLWGLLLGLGMTLVVQSSSATIGVLQGVARQAGPDGVHSLLGLAGAGPAVVRAAGGAAAAGGRRAGNYRAADRQRTHVVQCPLYPDLAAADASHGPAGNDTGAGKKNRIRSKMLLWQRPGG